MPLKILIIGDIVLDILPSPFPIAKEKIHSDGETFIQRITFQRGGNGGNFSVVLKSVYPEIEVIFYSRIGDDKNGDFLVQEMVQNQISTQFQRDSVPTQVSIAISYPDGERHFLTSVGALKNMTYSEIPLELFSNVHHVALRGIWFMENLLPDCHKILKYAQEKGISTSLDVGFDPFWHLSSQKETLMRKNDFLSALPHVTYLFGNQGEFLNLTSTTSMEEALKILGNAGVTTIIVHQGENGASIFSLTNETSPQEPVYDEIHIPAVKIEKIINPVGTGDTFDSIFLIQLLQNRSLTRAAVFAAGGAAYSLQNSPGTKITYKDIEAFCLQDPDLQKFP